MGKRHSKGATPGTGQDSRRRGKPRRTAGPGKSVEDLIDAVAAATDVKQGVEKGADPREIARKAGAMSWAIAIMEGGELVIVRRGLANPRCWDRADCKLMYDAAQDGRFHIKEEEDRNVVVFH